MEEKKPGPPKGQKLKEVKRTPVGERIFNARKARGLTQLELGKKVRLSKRMIAHYESNVYNPPIELLNKIADALNVSMCYLLGESTQKKINNNIKPIYRRHIELLQKLPVAKQKAVMEMVEGLYIKSKKETGKE